MWRRCTGILGLGIVQTVIVNVLILRQFSLQPAGRWLLSACYLVAATFCLARSKRARCVTVLIVPQFLSKRGRAALIGYIFLLTVAGPTANTMRNVEVLGETLSCTQQQLKAAIRETVQALKVPFRAMKQIIDSTLKTVERSFMKVQQTLMEILKLVKRILHSIKKAYDWLRDVLAICNDQLGSPSERCLKSLDKTIDGCKEEMGSMDFLCEVTQVAKSICYGATMVDYFCELIDFVSDSIVEEIEQGIQQLMQYMEDLFRVTVEYDHAYDFATNASKSFAEISADIRVEIAQRTLPLRRTFNLLGVVTSGFFICILIRAIQYHEAFLERDEFDNIFLTKEFYEIEKRRGELNVEPLLPLTRKERHRYVPLTSLHLTWKERLRIAKSATFLLISTVQIACQLFSDYALYWLLTLIKQFMHEESNHHKGSRFGGVGVSVRGDGILADTLRDIVRSFDPIVNGTVIDPSRCIPEALPPRFGRYVEILALLTLCWTFTLLEPYGLRVRQLIMRHFYPERARARAVWLHNDIRMKRENLLKLFRRFVGISKPVIGDRAKDSWMGVLRAKTNRFWVCRKLLGVGDAVRCFLCGETLIEQEDQFIRCSALDCPCVFCQDCFLRTGNYCSLCMNVLLHESTTTSDISFERLERTPTVKFDSAT